MSEASDPIFSRIARRYDLVNKLLTLGRDRAWRSAGVARLDGDLVLDLGSGTGPADFGDRKVVALDPVAEMLALSPVEARVVGVGEMLPFRPGVFDGVFSAYVMRNLGSVDLTLAEVGRVLRSEGRLVVIDLARPADPMLRALHRVGTAIVLPLVGLLFARAPREYWYLHKSLDSLPPPERLFAGSGFTIEEVWRMGLFGFVYGASLRKTGSRHQE